MPAGHFEVPAGAKGWLVVFHPHSAVWWVEKFCPDRWKHVSAIGFVPEANVWVTVSWELGRMRVCVTPDEKINEWLAVWCPEGSAVLRVAAPDYDRGPWRPRMGLFCVSMIAHLLGVRGALLPSQLWRTLLANGAEIATDGHFQPEGTASAADGWRESGIGERRARPA